MEIFLAIFLWPAHCTVLDSELPTFQYVGQYYSVTEAVTAIRDNAVQRLEDGVPAECKFEDSKFFIRSYVSI